MCNNNDGIEYHSDNMFAEKHPAINVKYYGLLPRGNENEDDAYYTYIATQQSWWARATEIAHTYGYTGVLSEGRSSGWLLPYYQGDNKWDEWPGQGPTLGYPSYPNMDDPKENERFRKFQKEILDLMKQVPTIYQQELRRISESPSEDS